MGASCRGYPHLQNILLWPVSRSTSTTRCSRQTHEEPTPPKQNLTAHFTDSAKVIELRKAWSLLCLAGVMPCPRTQPQQTDRELHVNQERFGDWRTHSTFWATVTLKFPYIYISILHLNPKWMATCFPGRCHVLSNNTTINWEEVGFEPIIHWLLDKMLYLMSHSDCQTVVHKSSYTLYF